MTEATGGPWREIATSFLKVGATVYGGPAIMGLMQAQLQDRRQWVSKTRFVERLALVNVIVMPPTMPSDLVEDRIDAVESSFLRTQPQEVCHEVGHS